MSSDGEFFISECEDGVKVGEEYDGGLVGGAECFDHF